MFEIIHNTFLTTNEQFGTGVVLGIDRDNDTYSLFSARKTAGKVTLRFAHPKKGDGTTSEKSFPVGITLGTNLRESIICQEHFGTHLKMRQKPESDKKEEEWKPTDDIPF